MVTFADFQTDHAELGGRPRVGGTLPIQGVAQNTVDNLLTSVQVFAVTPEPPPPTAADAAAAATTTPTLAPPPPAAATTTTTTSNPSPPTDTSTN